MAMIALDHVYFEYNGSSERVFEDLSLRIDTDWKTGLIGRNGRGKTTLLKILAGELEARGTVMKSQPAVYFPTTVLQKKVATRKLLQSFCPMAEEWELLRELSLLHAKEEILDRPFDTLSQGERTKVQLAALFCRPDVYLLIDEPTNHLDMESRQILAKYLKRKNGFLLVSHDRAFLDQCVDHICALNRSGVEIQQGNFSSWKKNRDAQNQFELQENVKLKKEIDRLQESAYRQAVWSNRIEASKYHQGPVDRGYIGAQSARMMKRAKNAEKRMNGAIEQKKKLLHDLEYAPDLKLTVLSHHAPVLVKAKALEVVYDGRTLIGPLDLILQNQERLAILGANGSGKSSLVRCLLQKSDHYRGQVSLASGLKISWVSQDTTFLQGSLQDYTKQRRLDPTLFLTILRKLDFRRELFERKMESYSEGQKKKVLIAASLAEPAHLLVWDEPLNYIDLDSRIQLENLILATPLSMILIEHDQQFVEKVATRYLRL